MPGMVFRSWYAGWFFRHRLKMAADLPGGAKLCRIPELGTGSGIFIKELLKHADWVTGTDIHATHHISPLYVVCHARREA
jgi:hypothetical protein